MSNQRIVHVADLSVIETGLRTIRSDVDTVSGQVASVGEEITHTRNELAALEELFREFIAADAMNQELQLAETRQVKVRQELESKFGYYEQVRRTAVGILQAADLSMVRQDTITAATEELMLAAPRYWLAPALVALGAWLDDNQPLADKALAEALRRDDEKTTLFFALVTRRAGRHAACATWMQRYLGLQDPFSLDRQTVVLVDALAGGVFGADIHQAGTMAARDWIAELSQRAGFVEEQRTQWMAALLSKLPVMDNSERYPHLHRYSATWPRLDASLNGAALHGAVLEHFRAIFDGDLAPSAGTAAAVDALLDKLVRNFDDDELPLRRDERHCQLIIDERGNRQAAQARYHLEAAALDERITFTQLLTNAAMHPDTSHASRATQRYATALSAPWIGAAYADVAAAHRAAVPTDIGLQIEGWQGRTGAGENQAELLSSLAAHLDAQAARDRAAVKLDVKYWAALALGAVFVVAGLFNMLWLALGLGAGAVAWFYSGWSRLAGARQAIASTHAARKAQATAVLHGALTEASAWRREVAQRDLAGGALHAIQDDVAAPYFGPAAPPAPHRVVG
ncbi:MAG: hypothetical protein ABW069_08535 [Duganella sp.]